MDNIKHQAIIEYLENPDWQLIAVDKENVGHSIPRRTIVFEMNTHHFRYYEYSYYFFYETTMTYCEIETTGIFWASEIVEALDEYARFPQGSTRTFFELTFDDLDGSDQQTKKVEEALTNAGFKNVHIDVLEESKEEEVTL